jgi:hypothetical protein
MGERVKIKVKTPDSKGKLSFSKTNKRVFPKTKSSPAGQILHLQRTFGNQAVQRLLKSGTIQAKLKIGKPNDKYEQEADRVAEKVMGMPEPRGTLVNSHSSSVQRESTCPECSEKEGIQTKPLADQITPLVQRQIGPEEEEEPVQGKLIQRQETEEEEEPVQTKRIQRQEAEEEEEPVQTKLQRQAEEEEETVQTKRIQRQEAEEEEEPVQAKQARNQKPAVNSNIESSVNSLKGGGQPLPDSTRSYFEPRFGADFSQVRVHTDSKAADTAKSINAKAFTKGKDVVFGSGQYSPGTSSGKRLLAHELTHVVQQSPLNSSDPELSEKISSSVGQRISRWKIDGDIATVESKKDTLWSLSKKLTGNGWDYILIKKIHMQSPKQDSPEYWRYIWIGDTFDISALKADKKNPCDVFGKECPNKVALNGKKSIPPFDKRMFNAGYRTYFGLVSNMKVGPKNRYESCISEVLKVVENTCGSKGNMVGYKPCSPKKYCMKVGKACGGDKLTKIKYPCSPITFVDLHRTRGKFNMLEGTGKKQCKVKCLQRYGCGGKEIGRFYVTRNFKASVYTDGSRKIPITVGTIEKVKA